MADKEEAERQRAEQALRESEERYRALFNAATNAVVVFLDNHVTMANPALCRLLGADNPAQLIGKSIFEFVDAEFHGAVRQRVKMVLDGETPPSMEARWVRVDGTNVDVEINSSALFLTGQNEVLVVAHDITERKKAMTALQESESKLKEAQQLARIGYFDHDLLADKITYSEETARLFGLPLDGVLNQAKLQEMIYPDDRHIQQEAFDQALRGVQSGDVEYRGILPDGEIRFVHAHDRLVKDKKGRTIRVFGALQDVTELKKAEQALETTIYQLHSLARRIESIREEERLNISREVHDELGTALSAVRFNLFELRDSYSKKDPEFRKEVESIVELIDKLIVTVQDISANLRPGVLDHLGILAAIEWQAERFQKHTNIECTLNLPQSEPEIDGNCSVNLFRILQELLTNVARHAGAKHVDVNFSESPDEFVMSVFDDGVGIPEDKLNDSNSLGLLGIRERLHPFGGSFRIARLPKSGTEAEVHVPKKQTSWGAP